MREDLVQYVWQYQLFDKRNLLTECGEEINIIKPGFLNHESGPDFLQAQIQLGEIIWFGAIEIHLKARDWHHHHHHHDPAYDNVILHVVWDKATEVTRNDGTTIPTLTLSSRVDQQLLKRYQLLTEQGLKKKVLSCSHFLQYVPDIYKASAIEQASASRIERKSKEILEMYQAHANDWHQTAFQSICRAYGFKTNASPFSQLGAKISYRCLLKERNSFESIAGILLYASGLSTQDNISDELKKCAQHMAKKYDLVKVRMAPHEFKHFPVRPANAPIVRIFQLAALIYCQPGLYEMLSSTNDLNIFYNLFDEANRKLLASKSLTNKLSRLGKESMQRIIINAVVPFRFAVAATHADEKHRESAIQLIENLPAENNRYTKFFKKEGFTMQSALETQGAIEQHRFYCVKSQCLRCPVGTYIMKNHDLVVI